MLPFENLSSSVDQEYFSDGMTDALITELSRVSRLRVTSRTSAMVFKGIRKPVGQIARALKVAYIVEGTVLRADDTVRISIQLIQAVEDAHLWARNYESPLSDVLRLQHEVATEVAGEVSGALIGDEKPRLKSTKSVNPVAYDQYLQGCQYSARYTEEGLTKGNACFERAIAADPDYAPAYASLANNYLMFVCPMELKPPSEAFEKIEALCQRALVLDDRLALAHSLVAVAKAMFHWDWIAAEADAVRAIELEPSNSMARHTYALYLVAKGDVERSQVEIEKALEIDPLSPFMHCSFGYCTFFGGKFALAKARILKAIEVYPDFFKSYLLLGLILLQEKDLPGAISAFEQAISLSGGGNPLMRALRGCAFAGIGQQNHTRAIIQELLSVSDQKYVSQIPFVFLYAALGEFDQAFAWLERAFAAHANYLMWLRCDPTFKALHFDPRFHEMLRRIGLPDLPGMQLPRSHFVSPSSLSTSVQS